MPLIPSLSRSSQKETIAVRVRVVVADCAEDERRYDIARTAQLFVRRAPALLCSGRAVGSASPPLETLPHKPEASSPNSPLREIVSEDDGIPFLRTSAGSTEKSHQNRELRFSLFPGFFNMWGL
jgi:hypothetical protein